MLSTESPAAVIAPPRRTTNSRRSGSSSPELAGVRRHGLNERSRRRPKAAAWSRSTLAITAVTFRAVGTCRNSFGPWALLPGPSTPVTTNCASGKRCPSMPMKLIEPPSPIARAGLPNASVDAWARDVLEPRCERRGVPPGRLLVGPVADLGAVRRVLGEQAARGRRWPPPDRGSGEGAARCRTRSSSAGRCRPGRSARTRRPR